MNEDTIIPLVSKETPSTHDRPLEREESREGHTDTNGVKNGEGRIGPDSVDHTEYPVADFLEPIGFGWTQEGFEARQAVKRYSEDTHADY